MMPVEARCVVIWVAERRRPALTRFREALVTLSYDIAHSTGDAVSSDEVHDAWRANVAPAIDEIEETTVANHALATVASGAGSSTASSLAVFGPVMTGDRNGLPPVDGVALTAMPVLEAFRARRAPAAEIRMQPFTFVSSGDRPLRE